jgi:hypothetical protein
MNEKWLIEVVIQAALCKDYPEEEEEEEAAADEAPAESAEAKTDQENQDAGEDKKMEES